MAEQNSKLYTELKSLFSLTKSQKTLQFAYGCMLGLILFTIFLTLSPSSNSSDSSLSNLYSVSLFNSSNFDYRSHFSNIFSYFSPQNYSKNETVTDFRENSKNHSINNFSKNPVLKNNNTSELQKFEKNETTSSEISKNPVEKNHNSTVEISKNPVLKNHNSTSELPKNPVLKNHNSTSELPKNPVLKNNSTSEKQKNPVEKNQSTSETSKNPVEKNNTKIEKPSTKIGQNSTKNITQKGVNETLSNLTSSLKKESNGTNSVNQRTNSTKSESERTKKEIIESLKKCDLFDGEWVRDETYPLYKPGSCSLIDEQFNCFVNGRPDNAYYQLKWKPKGCDIPRLNGTHMLEMLRGKRLVFVGDSLNRNMWESLICILRNFVKDQSKVYEASGRHHFRTEPSYSFVFQDYNCTIEFFVSPFLVQEWEMPDKSGSKKETLRLDLVGRAADQYKTADILIFNTGHWWTHEKTAKGKDYYQEGRHIYHDLNVLEAFHKALTTWGRWVDASVDPKKTLVFFRGYSASHFRGGQWNSGGQCDHETEPIKNTTYLSGYPSKMNVLEEVLHNLKTNVSYLNITRLTDFRKDGHPSMYRKQVLSKEELKSPLKFQDCSHWCLPGVPDAWNELLYAELLIKQSQSKQQ